MKYQVIYYLSEKEKNYYVKAADEYRKRLSLYCKTDYKQVKKEKEWKKLWDTEKNKVLVIPGPASPSSESFSDMLGKWEMEGTGRVTFFIPDTKELADWAQRCIDEKNCIYEDDCLQDKCNYTILNLSDFTLDSQILKVLLFEQIYRGYRIRNHHPYHK